MYRGAFTTTLTADGATFISASHSLIGGGTISNLLTSPAPLSSTNLNTAIVTLRQQKNQAGVSMGNVPSCLLVPSALFVLAIQLTESALVADSANNALNVFRSAYGITVYTSIFLDSVNGGSDTAWFLLARNHGVTRVIRQDIQTALRSWEYSDNRTYLYQANFRETVFVADYVGSVGATGV